MWFLVHFLSCAVAPKAFLYNSSDLPEDVEIAVSLQEHRLEVLDKRYGEDSAFTQRAKWNYGLMLMRTDPEKSDAVLKEYFTDTGYSFLELDIVMEGFNFVHRPDLNQHYIDRMVIECIETYGEADSETQFFRLIQANNLASLFQMQRAEAVFSTALEHLEQSEVYGLRVLVQLYYASMLLDDGRDEESLLMAKKALKELSDTDEDDSTMFLEVQNLLCLPSQQCGTFRRSDVMCNQVVDGTKTVFGEDSMNMLWL